jgi:brother of ihog
MVKWQVVPSSTDGSLPIQFFKVQYMMVPSEQRHKGQKSNEDWITLNEDIPPHLRSYEITHLKLDHHYKFRISAVYSNNDNKQSPIRRFHLKRVKQSIKASLPIPIDIQITPVSETEVTVRWAIAETHQHNFGGFYINYRPTTSADEYLIVSVEGSHKRHAVIKHLESGTSYEFKIQSFSSLEPSVFSAIVVGRTLSEFFVAIFIWN